MDVARSSLVGADERVWPAAAPAACATAVVLEGRRPCQPAFLVCVGKRVLADSSGANAGELLFVRWLPLCKSRVVDSGCGLVHMLVINRAQVIFGEVTTTCSAGSGSNTQPPQLDAGRDPFGSGYEAVLGELLVQGGFYAHKREHRLIWLEAALPLLQACFHLGASLGR